MSDANVSRRRVLRGVAAGAAASGMAGEAIANTSDEVNGHVVKFEPGASTDVARRKANAVTHEFDFGEIGKAVAGEFPAEAIEGLRKNPNVQYVEEDRVKYHAYAQTVPWGIDRVDADVVHANGETGQGADIAILDTGIDSDHPDLQANIQGGRAFGDIYCGSAGGGCRFGGSPNDNTCHYEWDDDNDHGTHCAGIADAVDNSEGVVGVSNEANLWAGKVLDGCGSGSLSAIAAGIEWAADQGFDVASMSLGASSGDQTLKDAVQYAQNKGVLLVAAAGNDGPCSDCVGYPAAYSEVVAVSSTDSDDTLSDFSSTGPEVELAAPGGEIYSTIPGGYDTFSGTSMACPHVSGAGAQLMADGYTNSEARRQLKDTAEDLGLASNEQGSGLLDVEAATGGGGDNTAPSCSVVNPADGDTVSGTVTVQVDAADSEDSDDSLDVEVAIDGGTYQTASYNSTSGYYEYDWDTTGVSDGDHTVDARAIDSGGATDTSQVTVTTDNGGSGDSAPTIDTFSVSNRSNGGWARFEVDWAVSDADGDLSQVDLTLEQNGSTADSASYAVSGSSASGSDRLQDKKGSGSYDVTLTVTDSAGNTTSQTKTVTA
ncbi:serine protease [Halobacteriales archaeon QS_1_68_20]|nr:MAG: serine protease [Halobacteriales archaeon QS_1_68_20]